MARSTISGGGELVAGIDVGEGEDGGTPLGGCAFDLTLGLWRSAPRSAKTSASVGVVPRDSAYSRAAAKRSVGTRRVVRFPFRFGPRIRSVPG